MQQTESAFPSSSMGTSNSLSYIKAENATTEEPSLSILAMAVAELFKAVNSALRGDRESAETAMRCVADAIKTGLSEASDAAIPLEEASLGGSVPRGLAPWQVRKIRTHLAANLTDGSTTRDLAEIVRLSPYHFSRAFRRSFGDSPHHYLLRLRIERSQGLMLTTQSTLANIALDCGLVDQAHFGKLFRQFVGESPAAWRRARMNVC